MKINNCIKKTKKLENIINSLQPRASTPEGFSRIYQ